MRRAWYRVPPLMMRQKTTLVSKLSSQPFGLLIYFSLAASPDLLFLFPASLFFFEELACFDRFFFVLLSPSGGFLPSLFLGFGFDLGS